MREVGTGLSRKQGKCTGNWCGISEIRADLIFRGANDQCSHNTNEICALRAELVFRDVPGKLVERRGQPQWFRRIGLCRRAPVDAPCDRITGVLITPVCLGLLTPRRLAVGIAAGSLPTSHSRIWPEPPATDGARSLPGLGHRDDLSSSSRLQPPRSRPQSVQNAWVISGEQRWVTSGKRRRRKAFSCSSAQVCELDRNTSRRTDLRL